MNQPDFLGSSLDRIICLETWWYEGPILEFSKSWVRTTPFLGISLFPEDSRISPTQLGHGQKSRKPGKGKTSEGEENLEGIKHLWVPPLRSVGKEAGHALSSLSLPCTCGGPEGKECLLRAYHGPGIMGDLLLMFFSVSPFNRSLREEFLAALQRRKVKLREVKNLGQCHTPRKESWILCF